MFVEKYLICLENCFSYVRKNFLVGEVSIKEMSILSIREESIRERLNYVDCIMSFKAYLNYYFPPVLPFVQLSTQLLSFLLSDLLQLPSAFLYSHLG